MLDTVGAVYYGLDRSGALLWELLVTGTPESELVARLVRDAPVDPAQARKDVHTFLTELRRHGLLEPV
ncbi:hypothetical protein Jiend_63410 [Micromonospora endophytica]|uniref:PqqD family protein n=1 Tax=Micromonospora endophytica TaxID=515350 RepID=UPI001BB3F447|nr:PqqD family protein [Micromonospora endophytica]BCJ62919.1 hypothetical protein Jiend_63410 [Micromonospora endophytica]